jgi:peptide/nickel transport system permease protein
VSSGGIAGVVTPSEPGRTRRGRLAPSVLNGPVRQRRGPGWLALITRRKTTLVGALLMLSMLLIGTLAPVIGGDPGLMDVAGRLRAPGRTHWFGTDDVGRDVFSRVVYGARLSLLVGASVVGFSFGVGVTCGLIAGFYRRLDNVVMRVMDGLMAFPAIVLAIALMAALGASVVNVIVAIGVVYSPRVARVVRGSVLVIRETSYVEAARALGAADLPLMARHVLPNCLSPVIVQASFVFAAAVLTEAALSFLGVGVPPYVPSWGVILAEGRLYIQQAPWLVIYPGVAIMLTIFGLNLFGDGLRDLLDPKIRGLTSERQSQT